MKRMGRKIKLLITNHRVITQGRLGARLKQGDISRQGRWF